MPQLTFPDIAQQMTTLVITLQAPQTPDEDLTVHVRVGLKGWAQPQSLLVLTLPGIETDYLDTLVEALATSFAYGERIKDVRDAGLGVKAQAAAHRRRCSM